MFSALCHKFIGEPLLFWLTPLSLVFNFIAVSYCTLGVNRFRVGFALFKDCYRDSKINRLRRVNMVPTSSFYAMDLFPGVRNMVVKCLVQKITCQHSCFCNLRVMFRWVDLSGRAIRAKSRIDWAKRSMNLDE